MKDVFEISNSSNLVFKIRFLKNSYYFISYEKNFFLSHMFYKIYEE
jgi:hypothetical protein